MNKFPKLESIIKPIIKNLGYNFLSINYQENKITIFVGKSIYKINTYDCEKIHKNLIYISHSHNYSCQLELACLKKHFHL